MHRLHCARCVRKPATAASQSFATLGEGTTEFTWQDKEVHIRRTEHYYLMYLADPQRDDPHFDSSHSEEALFRPSLGGRSGRGREGAFLRI